MKNLHITRGVFLAAGLLMFSAAGLADETSARAPAKDEAVPAAANADWKQVLRDLDNEQYAVREQASKRFATAGDLKAVPLLAEAVQTGSREVVWRGTRALEAIAIRGDEVTLESVLTAIQGLAKARPELAKLADGLRERQRVFRHQNAVAQLRQLGATVTEIGNDGEFVEEEEIVVGFGGFGGFIPLDAGPVEIVEIEEGPDVVGLEWEGPAEVMTLEDQLGMYDPIETTFIEQFQAELAKAAELPPALAGWEDMTEEDAALLDADPEIAAIRFADPAAEPPMLLEDIGARPALESLAKLESELAEAVEAEARARALPAEFPADDVGIAVPVEVDGIEIVDDIDVDAGGVLELALDDFIDPLAPGFFPIIEEETVQRATILQSTTVIDKAWKGGDEGIKQLAALEGRLDLTLQNAPLTDAAFKHLGELKQLSALAIIGGDFGPEALLEFHREHPAVQISARSNGWMGINAFGAPCQIGNVVEESAAEKAGIREGDILEKVDGIEVKDFTELTLAMAARDAGDTVKVTIKRGKETLVLPVTLHARPKF